MVEFAEGVSKSSGPNQTSVRAGDSSTWIVSLCIASSECHRTEKLDEGVYLLDDVGKVIHSYSAQVSRVSGTS